MRKRAALITVGIVLVLGIPAAWANLPVLGDLIGFCSNETFSVVEAPSGGRRVELFRRSCGATTGLGYSVSILRGPLSRSLGPGNVFFATWSDAAATESRPLPENPIVVRWLSASTLQVGYDHRLEALIKRPSRAGVMIQYSAF